MGLVTCVVVDVAVVVLVESPPQDNKRFVLCESKLPSVVVESSSE